jgi:hypothetical protein
VFCLLKQQETVCSDGMKILERKTGLGMEKLGIEFWLC